MTHLIMETRLPKELNRRIRIPRLLSFRVLLSEHFVYDFVAVIKLLKVCDIFMTL